MKEQHLFVDFTLTINVFLRIVRQLLNHFISMKTLAKKYQALYGIKILLDFL